MMLVSSFAMAVALAQPPVGSQPALPPPTVVYPVPPRPSPPPPPYPTIWVAPPAPPPPPPPLPTPSPAARELALRLVERVGMFEREARRAVMSQLRWTGSDGCDFGNAECLRVAEELAARETPRMVANARDAASRVLGAQFDRTMSAAQIADAARFFGDGAGQALIGSFVGLDRQTLEALEPAFHAMSRRRGDLAAEFARKTQHLPRATYPAPSIIRIPHAPPPPPRR